jgi:hypothetical protein
VSSFQQVAMPAQDRIRAHQELDAAELVQGQAVEQASENEPVIRRENGFGYLALRDGELVPQHQYLDLLVTLAHR